MGVDLAAVIAGYMSEEIFDKNKCGLCKMLLTTTKCNSSKYNYINKLSRGAVNDLIHGIKLHYVSKSFSILDCINDIIKKPLLPYHNWQICV